MTDYTPGIDQIRGRYCDGTYTQTGQLTDGSEFDRAIAKVRAEAKQEALREAADAMDADPGFRDPLRLKSDWLRARADKLVTL